MKMHLSDWLGIASVPSLVNPQVMMNLSTAATLDGESRCAEHCIALSVCYNVFEMAIFKKQFSASHASWCGTVCFYWFITAAGPHVRT